MACNDLRSFVQILVDGSDLHAVAPLVDPDGEIAAITDRVCKSRHNRALLFTAVRGSDYRVATNLFGSAERMALALGVERLGDLTGWFDKLLDPLQGGDAAAKLAALGNAPVWHAAAPRLRTQPGQLQEVTPNLNRLPILKNHPRDGQPDHGGRFLTLGTVITADPELSATNCGIYRAAVLAPDRLAISWGERSGAAAHATAWREIKQPMPVTIALGTAPALTFSATLPLPDGLDELTFSGLLQGAPLEVFRCGNGLPAPCDVEIVIEGYVDPGSVAPGGAFGNHTGFYTPSLPAAAMRVTAIRLRSDAIMAATVVGRPPMEDCWLARAGGHLLLSLLKIDVPQVVDLHLPFAGIFHGAAFISVKNAAGRGPELLAAIRRTPWFAGSRLLVLIDAGQEPANESGVLWRVMNTVDWSRDAIFSADKISIDATVKPCETREAVTGDPEIAALVVTRWKEYGFDD